MVQPVPPTTSPSTEVLVTQVAAGWTPGRPSGRSPATVPQSLASRRRTRPRGRPPPRSGRPAVRNGGRGGPTVRRGVGRRPRPGARVPMAGRPGATVVMSHRRRRDGSPGVGPDGTSWPTQAVGGGTSRCTSGGARPGRPAYRNSRSGRWCVADDDVPRRRHPPRQAVDPVSFGIPRSGRADRRGLPTHCRPDLASPSTPVGRSAVARGTPYRPSARRSAQRQVELSRSRWSSSTAIR